MSTPASAGARYVQAMTNQTPVYSNQVRRKKRKKPKVLRDTRAHTNSRQR